MTLETTQPVIDRDDWGRPYIKQVDGKAKAYTRTTTFVGAFEDTYNLEQWKMRQAAVGLSLRPDLQLAVHAHREDKARLNAICQEALDAAASSAAATTGTALHSLTEQVDRSIGRDVPFNLPLETQRDLAAYAEATRDLEPLLIEQMMVHDELKVAGTPDRVVAYQGGIYIADLKTGGIDYGAGKIAAQLAMYARSQVYNHATGERSEHGASLDKGIVIHLPAGTGTCELQWIDLRAGWEIVKVCKDVRGVRRLSARQLFTSMAPKTDRTLHQILAGPAVTATAPWGMDELGAAVATASSRDQITAMWREYAHLWTEDLTRIAAERIAELEAS